MFPATVPIEAIDEARRQRKEQKRAEESTRPLDGWERYRALNDAIDEAYELVDLSNREARFGLIIVGAVNAGVLVVASRVHLATVLAGARGPLLVGAFVVYAVACLYVLLSAIETLRPRRAPTVRSAMTWNAWQTTHMAKLSEELAGQVRALGRVNQLKQAALNRFYAGLRALTLTSVLVLTLLGLLTSF